MLTECREYRERLIELARGAVAADERRALMAHVDVCAECAQALEGQLALSAALESMAAEGLPEMAAIEARVLAEFDRAAARRVSRWVLVAGLAAAVCLGVVWVERRREPVERPRVGVTTVAVQTAPASRPVSVVQRVRHTVARRQAHEESQPFLEIPYTVPLAPEEQTTVVRMEIPVAALIAVGFSVPASDAGAVVEAEVLVSQDGRARAIRPISISASR
jgi:hypothetical protein